MLYFHKSTNTDAKDSAASRSLDTTPRFGPKKEKKEKSEKSKKKEKSNPQTPANLSAAHRYLDDLAAAQRYYIHVHMCVCVCVCINI